MLRPAIGVLGGGSDRRIRSINALAGEIFCLPEEIPGVLPFPEVMSAVIEVDVVVRRVPLVPLHDVVLVVIIEFVPALALGFGSGGLQCSQCDQSRSKAHDHLVAHLNDSGFS